MFIWRCQKFSLCSIFSFWLWSFLLGFCSELEQSLSGVRKLPEVSLGEKIFISAISLYASLRFFHFLFYDQFFLSSSFFPLLSQACSFFSVLYILQFCMLTFLRLHSFLKVSNLFSYYHHFLCYRNFLVLKVMFLTFLLSFRKMCPHHISLLACGFTLLADWNHCLQSIDFKSSAAGPLIQSRSFEAKLGPSSRIWAVLPGNLPLRSCVSWFTPACAAGTIFFGFAGKAFQDHLQLFCGPVCCSREAGMNMSLGHLLWHHSC